MPYIPTGLGATYDRRPPANASAYPPCITAEQYAAAHAACKPMALRGLGAYLAVSTANPCWVETLPICARGPSMRDAPKRKPIDWAALARYAAAVKAAADKRNAELVQYAKALQAAKDRADLIAYAAALKAANDKRIADLIAYAAAVKAAQTPPKTGGPSMRSPMPAPPPPPQAPPLRPPVLRDPPKPGVPPPPPPKTPPAPPAEAPPVVSEAPPLEDGGPPTPPAQASMSAGRILALTAVGVGGWWLLFGRKRKHRDDR